jgi:hypothetical protein
MVTTIVAQTVPAEPAASSAAARTRRGGQAEQVLELGRMRRAVRDRHPR